MTTDLADLTFLYIGPPKCGSTWLQRLLEAHPLVDVPRAKDLYYFDRFYSRGDDWYLSHFAWDVEASARGEVCHDYLYSSAALDRISTRLPNATILVILRNPLERAWSHFIQSVRVGNVRPPFEQAIKSNDLIVDRSRYATYLPAWRERYGQNLQVLLFDDLRADPIAFARTVLTTLGAAPDVPEVTTSRHNEAAQPRSRLISRLAHSSARGLRSLGFEQLVGRAKSSQRLAKALTRESAFDIKQVVAVEDRLLREFEPDVALAEDLCGRPLPHWRARLSDK